MPPCGWLPSTPWTWRRSISCATTPRMASTSTPATSNCTASWRTQVAHGQSREGRGGLVSRGLKATDRDPQLGPGGHGGSANQILCPTETREGVIRPCRVVFWQLGQPILGLLPVLSGFDAPILGLFPGPVAFRPVGRASGGAPSAGALRRASCRFCSASSGRPSPDTTCSRPRLSSRSGEPRNIPRR